MKKQEKAKRSHLHNQKINFLLIPNWKIKCQTIQSNNDLHLQNEQLAVWLSVALAHSKYPFSET